MSKRVAGSILLCNKLYLTETFILYELDKHIGMTTVKKSDYEVLIETTKIEELIYIEKLSELSV